jgi:HSP20 family protein
VTLARRDPVEEMITRQERFNRLLARLRTGVWTPAIGVTETPDAIILRAELAAFQSEDLRAPVGDNGLAMEGERRREEERRQRLYRSVEWTDGFNATYESGVLTLRLSKAREVEGKPIRDQGQAREGLTELGASDAAFVRRWNHASSRAATGDVSYLDGTEVP